MVPTEGLDSRTGAVLLRLPVALLVAIPGAAFMGFVQAGDLTAAPAASVASATDVLVMPRDGGGDGRTGLRSSVTLGTSRSVTRPRPEGEAVLPARSPVAAGEPLRLRLQRSLATETTSAGSSMRRALPGGELNREGIVRAGRILIRGGTIVLESDDKRQEETGAKVDRSPASFPNDLVPAEAWNQRTSARGK